ncbi:hypothetical protein NE852_03315 [Rhizobium sp. Pop5]|uniref:DUF6953 family protein n=1 Tax=Rhizobium sp. Pop5 TaxID=1223565 RepID=UPI000283C33C|nr:hypothetical protein [Rhizobium sp. Pop5]EJZ22439.1 hypothetical protein RCCGEPOP_04726 [Rhizobium sp. Pop5]UVD57255.1 hypothetical protein NE852_03315 [Rhizobium sp. Pop5]
MTATAADVAAWMMERLSADGALYQDVAASEIASKFGEDFVTINAAGNVGIAKPVLTAFNKLSGDDVVWSRGNRYWRKREDYDLPGRQQP